MQLRTKLTLSFLLVGILPLMFLGYAATHNAISALTTQAYQQLDSVRDLKKRLVEEYFQATQNHVATFASNYMVEYALNEFRQRLNTFASDHGIDTERRAQYKATVNDYYAHLNQQLQQADSGLDRLPQGMVDQLDDNALSLQYFYIAQNSSDTTNKTSPTGDNSAYSKFHHSIHDKFLDFSHQFGYRDILLVDASSGQIIYTVQKSIDLGASLLNGSLANTHLGQIFAHAKNLPRGSVVLSDYARYLPSLGKPASFAAAPIYDHDHVSGVLIFHLAIDKLNDIMKLSAGLGTTGESYLVGSDRLMRSDSRHAPTSHSVDQSFSAPEQGSINTPVVAKALAGDTRSELTTNYLNTDVLSSYAPIKIGDTQWALVVETSAREAFAAVHKLKWLAIAIFIGCAIGILGFALVFAQSLVKPLASAIRIADRIAKGHFDNRIPPPEPDETGHLLSALEHMQEELKNNIAKTQQTADEALRIKVALDNMSGMVLVTAANGDIIYMNESMGTFVDALLMRSPASMKHVNDLHPTISGLLGNRSHKRVELDNRVVEMVINPVTNTQQQRLGYAIEWTDITEQLVAEQQVQELIQHATRGMLESRLNTETHSGFMRRLADNINALLDAVATPIKETQELWHNLSQGNLAHTMRGEYTGEFATLQGESNNFVNRLRELVREIRNTSEGVHSTTGSVADSNAALNKRTDDLKTALADTAVSITQITTAVRDTSSRAEKAKKLTSKAKSQAETGLGVMDHTVTAMRALQAASDRIADIIGVMDSIAFQTNLLALNASVEAARAGEHGRGFAVVATEVRHLAQKSAESGKEIKALVEDAVAKTQEGTHLVSQSSHAFNEIVQTVKEVSDLITEIAVATSHQTSRIVEINQTMANIDKGAHLNLEVVQNIDTSIDRLSDYSKRMRSLLQFFTQNQLEERRTRGTH
jgi:methyl-accepting chemotaxis protein